MREFYESDANFVAQKKRFLRFATWFGVVVSLAVAAIRLAEGEWPSAVPPIIFAIGAPWLLWYMDRTDRTYRKAMVLFAILCSLGCVAGAGVNMQDPASLVWFGIYPIAFFFLLGPKLGYRWALANGLLLVVAYLSYGTVFGPPQSLKVFTLAMLAYSVSMLLSGYYARILDDFQHQLYTRANYDVLTGALSRLKGLELLEKHTVDDKRQLAKAPLALILFDIDDFKAINDDYGHDLGDSILRAVSHGIIHSVRKSDQLVRWGGEEFVLLLPNTRPADAKRIAEELCVLVPKITRGITPRSQTVSVGVTDFRSGETVESLLRRVDLLMYAAKRSGKDAVRSDFLGESEPSDIELTF